MKKQDVAKPVWLLTVSAALVLPISNKAFAEKLQCPSESVLCMELKDGKIKCDDVSYTKSGIEAVMVNRTVFNQLVNTTGTNRNTAAALELRNNPEFQEQVGKQLALLIEKVRAVNSAPGKMFHAMDNKEARAIIREAILGNLNDRGWPTAPPIPVHSDGGIAR